MTYPVMSMIQFEIWVLPQREGPSSASSRPGIDPAISPHKHQADNLSVGQAGAAGGFLGLLRGHPAVTGTAGPTQVRDARMAMVSGFGMINYDRGVCSGQPLSRDRA